jgi:hypothetical protein
VFAASLALLMGAGKSPAGHTDRQVRDDAFGAMVNAMIGLSQSTLVDLGTGFEPGRAMEVTLPIQGEELTISLWPNSVRSDHYQVFIADADSNLVSVEPGPVNTFRGVAVEDVGSSASASLIDGGLFGHVELSDGEVFWFEPIFPHVGVGRGIHVIYHNGDVLPSAGECGTPSGFSREVDQLGGIEDPGPLTGGNIYVCDLACDADTFYRQRWGANVESRINSVINTMNTQYLRDGDIRHDIGTIIIRTTDVYTSTDPNTLLGMVRSRWLSFHGGVVRDVVEMFSGRAMNGNVIGIAYLNGICSTNTGYNVVVSDFNNTFSCATDLSAHELGHNWNLPHCNCPGYTMNPFIQCANRFHPTFDIPALISYRNGRGCLVIESGAPGRCCFPNGSCQVLTQQECLTQGGDPGPPGSACTPESCPQPAPPNDECAQGLAIGEGSFDFDTRGATTDGPALPAQCDEGFGLSFVKDIWYFYTPTCDGTATVELCDSDYDTRLAVYIQTGACPGVFFGCNDDACGEEGLRSSLTFQAFTEFVYAIRVGGFEGGGTGTMNVTCGGGGCPEDFDGDGTIGFSDLVAILSNWGPCKAECPWDLDKDGEVSFSDLVQVLAAWGPCEP